MRLELFMIQQTMLYKMAFQYGGDQNGILMSAAMRIYGFSFIFFKLFNSLWSIIL